jgi:hemerythrin
VTRVHDIQIKFASGKPVLSEELTDFVQHWVTDHIMETDKLYVPFLAAAGLN